MVVDFLSVGDVDGGYNLRSRERRSVGDDERRKEKTNHPSC